MNIDFLHNQIIRDTITERFIESFNENLVPYLISEYGSALTEVQFYEDHLASGFRVDGEFHYPLTLVADGRAFTRWIKWPVANYRNYDKFNPYTYKGAELLEFELLDEAPEMLKGVIAGRPIYADDSAMPVVLASTVGDKTFLAGKFSQGFVDALSRAVTDAIECEFDINGLGQSGVVLELRFMPGTFMEHIVENSTYRRVLIKARGCAPRDLWVKWTRLDGRGTYTISDNADTDEIIFEIADEVPGKIREKEYRYLTADSVEKYQSAMSRKNMTEWREMMRRVIRRGEVEKNDVEPKLAITAPIDDEEPIDEIVEAAPAASEVNTAPVIEDTVTETDPLKALLASLENETDEPEEEEVDDDLSDLLKTAIGITSGAAYTADIEDEELDEEEDTEYEEDEAEDDEEPEEELTESDDIPVRVNTESIEDKARLEIEQKIRAELEEELRRKQEEAEELRARLEAQLRAEMREKELMAEAARAAIQEQQRLAKEREEAEARAREEEERQRAERERAEEEARIANARAQEEARIRAELEAKERARQEAEAAEAAKAAASDVKYVSKVAKLIFRSSIDQGVTKRIHEIILATIKYYHKEDVYIKIKATIPDSTTVNLEFVKIPENEIPLIVNIIKVLGRSDLGITRATLD